MLLNSVRWTLSYVSEVSASNYCCCPHSRFHIILTQQGWGFFSTFLNKKLQVTVRSLIILKLYSQRALSIFQLLNAAPQVTHWMKMMRLLKPISFPRASPFLPWIQIIFRLISSGNVAPGTIKPIRKCCLSPPWSQSQLFIEIST